MEWMVLDDLLNIAAIVLLMGLGVGIFFGIVILYLGAFGILEDVT